MWRTTAFEVGVSIPCRVNRGVIDVFPGSRQQNDSQQISPYAYLLRSLLVLVTLAGKADTHPGGHVTHTFREKELVQLGVDAHIAVENHTKDETGFAGGMKLHEFHVGP